MTVAKQLHHSKTHQKGFDPNCPACVKCIKPRDIQYRVAAKARAVELTDRLMTLDAERLYSIELPHGGSLTFYLLKGRPILVQWYANSSGYEVFAPVSNDSTIKGMFDALDALFAKKSEESAQ